MIKLFSINSLKYNECNTLIHTKQLPRLQEMFGFYSSLESEHEFEGLNSDL